MEVNWLDALLAVVMLLSVAAAVARGFMYSAVGLAAVILAFTLALSQGGILLELFDAVLESSGVAAALSYAVVFVVALLFFGALGKLIRKVAGKLDLGGLDRFAGFCFGLARGGILVVVIVLAFGALPLGNTTAWKESAAVPVAGAVAYLLLGKGGVLETDFWSFDERRRPSLRFLSAAPSALAYDEDEFNESEQDKNEENESDSSDSGEESGVLGLNKKTRGQIEDILGAEEKPCVESEDESCAE